MSESVGKKMKPPPILPPPITVDFSNDDDDAIVHIDEPDNDLAAR